MCLTVDAAKTKAWIKKNRGKKSIRVYKLLEIPELLDSQGKIILNKLGESTRDYKKLVAPYRNSEYKPGVIKSGSRVKGLCLTQGREINIGIHTYANQCLAIVSLTFSNKFYRLVELRVDFDDFIAAGNEDLVFRKVRLTEHAYKKALKASWKNLKPKKKLARKG